MRTYILPVSNIHEPTRKGLVCYHSGSLKFWNSNVDFTIETARLNGRITNVVAIEKESSGNWLLRKKCIIVRGN